jgi:hypothetical protein
VLLAPVAVGPLVATVGAVALAAVVDYALALWRTRRA